MELAPDAVDEKSLSPPRVQVIVETELGFLGFEGVYYTMELYGGFLK